VEIHMQHIQLGLGQCGSLQPFMIQRAWGAFMIFLPSCIVHPCHLFVWLITSLMQWWFSLCVYVYVYESAGEKWGEGFKWRKEKEKLIGGDDRGERVQISGPSALIVIDEE
jgi:hypothetical protein